MAELKHLLLRQLAHIEQTKQVRLPDLPLRFQVSVPPTLRCEVILRECGAQTMEVGDLVGAFMEAEYCVVPAPEEVFQLLAFLEGCRLQILDFLSAVKTGLELTWARISCQSSRSCLSWRWLSSPMSAFRRKCPVTGSV